MKLHKVRIQKFRAIEESNLTFEDPLGRIRPITVLAGPNGCGKTSVLFAIVQALHGVMGYKTDDVPEPSDLDIHRTGTLGGLSRSPVSVSVKLDLEFDVDERESIHKVLEDTRDLYNEKIPSDIPDGRVSVEWKYPLDPNPDGSRKPYWYLNKVEPWGALPLFHGRKRAIRGWRERKLSRTLLDHVGGIYLFPQDRNLRSRVVGDGSDMPERQHIANFNNQFDEEPQRGKNRDLSGVF